MEDVFEDENPTAMLPLKSTPTENQDTGIATAEMHKPSTEDADVVQDAVTEVCPIADNTMKTVVEATALTPKPSVTWIPTDATG